MSAPQVDHSPTDQKAMQERARAIIELRKRQGIWGGGIQAHTDYQKRPVQWIVDKLGIPEPTLRWSMYPEYQCCHCPRCVNLGNEGKPHIWDGDVDPIAMALEGIAAGLWQAVSSGTGTGKTFGIGACGVQWWLACYVKSIAISFAPREMQLLLNLWKEVGNLNPKFKTLFPSSKMTEGKLRMLEGDGQKEVWAATALGAGVGADEETSQRLKGSHGPVMLWMLEEMPGIDPAHINTIVNTATGAFNPICALGNPQHEYDSLGMFGRRAGVRRIRISALDHPNVVTGKDLIPGAVTRASIDRRLEDADGDEDDALYLAQVRGIAPAQAANALIKRHWLDAAAARAKLNEDGTPKEPAWRVGSKALGVDLADSDGGDRAAVSRWQGAYAEVEALRCPDASQLGEDLVEEARKKGIDGHRVGIDSAGIGGPVYKMMRRRGLKGIRPLNGGAKPLPMLDQDILWGEVRLTEDGRLRPGGPKVSMSERFDNLRSQMFWILREDLREGRIALKENKPLWDELLAITKEDEAGMIWVVEKKATKKVIHRSPDMADALAYGNFVRDRSWMPSAENTATRDPHARVKDVDTVLERRMARIDREQRQQDRANRMAVRSFARGRRR